MQIVKYLLILLVLVFAIGSQWKPIGGSTSPDSIGTSELNDGVDVPAVGECVAVDDVDNAKLQYKACGAGGGGDNVSVDGLATVDPNFADTGDINFTNTANVISGDVQINSVALGTDTTGNYAAGDAESGSALSGDSATNFFSVGSISDARIDDTITASNYVLKAGDTMTGDLTVSGSVDTGFIIGSSGNVFVENSAPGVIEQLYRNVGATSNAPILYIKSDNTADAQPALRIDHDGTGGGAANIQMRAPTPQIEWIETDQTTPAGKFEEGIVGDIWRLSGRNSTDNAFEKIVEFNRFANGGRMSFSTGTGINEFSIDGTLAGNTDDAIPTEKAVKTYVDGQIHTDTQLTQEQVEDFVGAVVANVTGTHTGLTVTYQDVTNDFDFVVGNAQTATALAANGGNCAPGNYPLGVDASIVAEGCTPDDDIPEAGDFGNATDLDANGAVVANGVALTTDTTGNYVGTVAAGTGITIAEADGEGVTKTVVATLGTAIDSTEITDGVINFPDINFSNTLAGNPTLAVDECFFFSDLSGGGFLCEGSTADTSEQLYRLPNLNGVDTTQYFVIADNELVTPTEVGYLDGVTSAIQTQLNAKEGTLTNEAGLYAALSDVTNFLQTGDALAGGDITAGSISATELATNSVGELELVESMNFIPTGTWNYGGGVLEIPNGITLPATCNVGEQFMDTDATTGQRHYLCESANVWALQGDGGGAGGGDNVSVNTAAVVDPDFVSTGDIKFTDTTNTITADIGAGTIIEPDLNALVAPVNLDYLQYSSAATNFTWRSPAEVLLDIGGLANIIEDTTPQLGGQLDTNLNCLGDGTLEQLCFVETALAVNEVTLTNAAATTAPIVSASGTDANIDLKLAGKGTGIPIGMRKYAVRPLVAAATDIAVATTVAGDFRIPFTGTIKRVGCYVSTAGTTGTMTVDINKAGTSIMNTNKVTIDSAEKTSETAVTAPALTTTAYTADDILTFDVDVIQTTAAKGLECWLDIELTAGG